MYVCICNGVTDTTIRAAAAEGVSSLAELTMRTGCAGTCGACADFAESVWWLLEEYAPAQVADELDAGRLLLDSNLRGQALVLSIDAFSEEPFDVTLDPRWRGAHANRPFDPTRAPVLDADAPGNAEPL